MLKDKPVQQGPKEWTDLEQIRNLWLGVGQSLALVALMASVFAAFGARAEETLPVANTEVIGVAEKGNRITWVEIESRVFYPTPCFSPVLSYGHLDKENKRIVLYHFAKDSGVVCTQMLQQKSVKYQVGGLKGKVYEIWDGCENQLIGELDMR